MKNNKNNLSGFSLIELSIVILIIGILIAGVTQGSRLVRESRLSSAKTLTQSSDVASIADLTLWLDATDEETIETNNEFGNAEDGETVTQWNDKNPQLSNGVNLTGTAEYREVGINGLPALDFNGTDHVLSNTSLTPIGATDSSYTIKWYH